MTDIDLTRWCRQNAEDYREYEHINMAVPPTSGDRDTAIVEWVVRVLGNPELPESREVLRLLSERHETPLTQLLVEERNELLAVLREVRKVATDSLGAGRQIEAHAARGDSAAVIFYAGAATALARVHDVLDRSAS